MKRFVSLLVLLLCGICVNAQYIIEDGGDLQTNTTHYVLGDTIFYHLQFLDTLHYTFQAHDTRRQPGTLIQLVDGKWVELPLRYSLLCDPIECYYSNPCPYVNMSIYPDSMVAYYDSGYHRLERKVATCRVVLYTEKGMIYSNPFELFGDER